MTRSADEPPATAAPGRGGGRRPLLVALAGAATLAACGSAPPRAPAPAPPAPPPERDGPHPNPPAGLDRVPDAVPRVEPLRTGGPNKAYEVGGRRFTPFTDDRPFEETGLASWYGRRFHGRPTALGEPYDMHAMTAAHRTMPLPGYARVRHLASGREVIVRVNDRGPFVEGRVIDLSYRAALRLAVLGGVAPVRVVRITLAAIRDGSWREPAAGGGMRRPRPEELLP